MRRVAGNYNDDEIYRSGDRVAERRTSRESSHKDRKNSAERALDIEPIPDYFDLHEDDLCEEQTMSFFISDKNDNGSYKTKVEKKTIEMTGQKRSSRNVIDDAQDIQVENFYAETIHNDRDSYDPAVSYNERSKSPASSSDQYKKLGMTGVQEMEYIVEHASSTNLNSEYLSAQRTTPDSELVTNSFGNPVGTIASSDDTTSPKETHPKNAVYTTTANITLSKEADLEEQASGRFVTSLYSPDLHDQIQDLEYRKSNLGIRELDALTNTPVIIGHTRTGKEYT